MSATIELLTGDHDLVASSLASHLGIDYRARLLPEEKIDIVQQYQAQGHTVVTVGNGVNHAPALTQADIEIAMGVAGADVAMDAAHLALMCDDWELVPAAFAIAYHTMRLVNRIGRHPRGDLLPLPVKRVFVSASPAQDAFSPLLLAVQDVEGWCHIRDALLVRNISCCTTFYGKDTDGSRRGA